MMAVTYTDSEIYDFVIERKRLPLNWRERMRLRSKIGHSESELELTGEAGSEFRLILRQNTVNVLDFSIIFAVRIEQSNTIFRLRRYNGKSHEHTNSIEGEKFYDYHVHKATERYQLIGAREDAYAEPTDQYVDLDGALSIRQVELNFDVPPEDQLRLL